ncbi:unnamed protein product [Boreogadus saida]
MAASVSTSQQHAFDHHRPAGMNPSHDARRRAPGPQPPAPGPQSSGQYGSPGPSERDKPPPQHHQKPYFYVQPSQPYVPMQSNMQWHMPLSYNPYYGYPGLGYAMQPMNTYPMNGYMEPPGYVMPQSHLHLVDYRRMLSPQYYHTLAYQSRTLGYQHGSSGRDMISSEVQTEPLSASKKSNAAASCGGGVDAHNGFPQGIHDCAERNDPGPAHLPPQAQSAQTGDRLVELEKTSPSPVAGKAPQKSSFVIQTEELRIECCSSAVGLEVLRSRETPEMELAHGYAARDLGHCGSLLTPTPVPQAVAGSAPKERLDIGQQVVPDLVLVGTDSCGATAGTTPSWHEPKAQIKRTDASPDSGSRVEVRRGVGQETTAERGQKRSTDANVGCGANDDGLVKVLHMPFDLDYLDELRSMETTVWSMEETVLSSPDWMSQTTLIDSHMDTLVEEVKDPREEDLMDVFAEEFTMEQVVPMIEMPQSEEELLIELGSTRDAPPVVISAPQPVGLASADVCDAEVASTAHLVHDSGASHAHSSESVVGLPGTGDAIQHESELTDHTSFESLPAFLPTDHSNIVHLREMPQPPKKPSKSQSAHNSEEPIERRKPSKESKEAHTVQRPKAEKGDKANVNRHSVSDHECCLRRNLNENAFPARRPRLERLCSRCLANRSGCPTVSPGSQSVQLYKRRCPAPLQPWLQPGCVLPTCEACKTLARKRLTLGRGTSSDVCGSGWHDDVDAAAGGATSENGSYRRVVPKWSVMLDDPRRACAESKRRLQVTSRNRPEKCPLAFGERNCACDEHRVPGWDGRSRRAPGTGNVVQDTDENGVLPVRSQDKWGGVERHNGYKWKNEKSFTSMVFNRNMAGHKDAVISQHLNTQKKSQPLSQGTHRKVTRC